MSMETYLRTHIDYCHAPLKILTGYVSEVKGSTCVQCPDLSDLGSRAGLEPVPSFCRNLLPVLLPVPLPVLAPITYLKGSPAVIVEDDLT